MWLIILLIVAGCSQNHPMEDERKFIESYCEIMRFYSESVFDSAQYRIGVDSILANHGVDRRFMRNFVDNLAGDAETQKRIFKEIARISSLPDSISTKAGRSKSVSSEIP